jgi:hypothetical protein
VLTSKVSFAVIEALNHPYLASLHDINDEPSCPYPFMFDFEQQNLTEDIVRELIYEESCFYNPDPPGPDDDVMMG